MRILNKLTWKLCTNSSTCRRIRQAYICNVQPSSEAARPSHFPRRKRTVSQCSMSRKLLANEPMVQDACHIGYMCNQVAGSKQFLSIRPYTQRNGCPGVQNWDIVPYSSLWFRCIHSSTRRAFVPSACSCSLPCMGCLRFFEIATRARSDSHAVCTTDP